MIFLLLVATGRRFASSLGCRRKPRGSSACWTLQVRSTQERGGLGRSWENIASAVGRWSGNPVDGDRGQQLIGGRPTMERPRAIASRILLPYRLQPFRCGILALFLVLAVGTLT